MPWSPPLGDLVSDRLGFNPATQMWEPVAGSGDLPTGTVDNSALKWDDGNQQWIEETLVRMFRDANEIRVLIGDGSRSAKLELDKDGADSGQLTWRSDGQFIWSFSANPNEDLSLEWYIAGVFQSNTLVVRNATGVFEFQQEIQIDNASYLHSGTGVPGAGFGVNGDFFFRTDGAGGTALYYKSGGAWAAIA